MLDPRIGLFGTLASSAYLVINHCALRYVHSGASIRDPSLASKVTEFEKVRDFLGLVHLANILTHSHLASCEVRGMPPY